MEQGKVTVAEQAVAHLMSRHGISVLIWPIEVGREMFWHKMQRACVLAWETTVSVQLPVLLFFISVLSKL